MGGGQKRQQKGDSFVLMSTTPSTLIGLTTPKTANEAGNKQTINLALACLCWLSYFLQLLQRP